MSNEESRLGWWAFVGVPSVGWWSWGLGPITVYPFVLLLQLPILLAIIAVSKSRALCAYSGLLLSSFLPMWLWWLLSVLSLPCPTKLSAVERCCWQSSPSSRCNSPNNPKWASCLTSPSTFQLPPSNIPSQIWVREAGISSETQLYRFILLWLQDIYWDIADFPQLLNE